MDFYEFKVVKQIMQNIRKQIIVAHLCILYYKTDGFFMVITVFHIYQKDELQINLVSNSMLSILRYTYLYDYLSLSSSLRKCAFLALPVQAFLDVGGHKSLYRE